MCTIGQTCEQPFQTHPKQLIFNENKRSHVNSINGCEMVDMENFDDCNNCLEVTKINSYSKLLKCFQVTASTRTCGGEVKCRRLRSGRSLVQILGRPQLVKFLFFKFRLACCTLVLTIQLILKIQH